eukprot:TRINITY_DN4538_c0_g1_i1.p1 TRINITY_DN4538_c0_g1~~TRINITY_DN4538_c0_g1_i1.p1  ORF type:complete len:103 (+),score=2.44 TRINITY_DN4538_c0_g1_i1:109-417(+)
MSEFSHLVIPYCQSSSSVVTSVAENCWRMKTNFILSFASLFLAITSTQDWLLETPEAGTVSSGATIERTLEEGFTTVSKQDCNRRTPHFIPRLLDLTFPYAP